MQFPQHRTIAEAVTSLALAQVLGELLCRGSSSSKRLIFRAFCTALLAHGSCAAYAHGHGVGSVHAPESLQARLGLLIVAHSVFAYCDCHIRGLTWYPFVKAFGEAIVYVLPVYPLLVITGSAILLACTSAVQVVAGMQSTSLRWLIDLGSLHAPFFCVHARLRRAIVGRPERQSPLLPVTTRSPVATSTAALREQRVRHFTS